MAALKLCVDCRHRRKGDGADDMFCIGFEDVCTAQAISVCPVTGTKSYLDCTDQRRKEYGSCGMEARLWEPKLTLGQKLIALFK